MEWSKAYKPERKANWEDIARAIHDTVTMEDVLSTYCPDIPRRRDRCPCPIHNGEDFNFSFSKKGYKCFVCGASGDNIGFVKDYLSLPSRSDAMRRINSDLGLGLPIDGAVSVRQNAEFLRRREEAKAKQRQRDEWLERYHALLDEWIELDKTIRSADPTSDEYAEAIKRIPYISYLLDTVGEEPR